MAGHVEQSKLSKARCHTRRSQTRRPTRNLEIGRTFAGDNPATYSQVADTLMFSWCLEEPLGKFRYVRDLNHHLEVPYALYQKLLDYFFTIRTIRITIVTYITIAITHEMMCSTSSINPKTVLSNAI